MILSIQTTPGYSLILAAISNLDQNLNAGIDLIENNYSNQVHGINAITRGRGYCRGNNTIIEIIERIIMLIEMHR